MCAYTCALFVVYWVVWAISVRTSLPVDRQGRKLLLWSFYRCVYCAVACCMHTRTVLLYCTLPDCTWLDWIVPLYTFVFRNLLVGLNQYFVFLCGAFVFNEQHHTAISPDLYLRFVFFLLGWHITSGIFLMTVNCQHQGLHVVGLSNDNNTKTEIMENDPRVVLSVRVILSYFLRRDEWGLDVFCTWRLLHKFAWAAEDIASVCYINTLHVRPRGHGWTLF